MIKELRDFVLVTLAAFFICGAIGPYFVEEVVKSAGLMAYNTKVYQVDGREIVAFWPSNIVIYFRYFCGFMSLVSIVVFYKKTSRQ